MGTSCCCPYIDHSRLLEAPDLKIFKFPKISSEMPEIVQNKIKDMTGLNPYIYKRIKLNKTRLEINGTYFQYNKGCIIYAIINNGWINEQDIPDSMKCYKDHNHWEDEKNDKDFLKRIISVIDLAQLWVNIGGESPYLELDLDEVRNRIYLVLMDYFKNPNTGIMKLVNQMSFQTKDYYELLGKINIKFIPLMELIKDNPCIKKGIDENIIKKRDMIKFGRHCFIYDEIFEENSKQIYSFQDSLSYFHRGKNNKKPNPYYENCECDKKKGFVFAPEDSRLINVNNTEEMEIGILSVIN